MIECKYCKSPAKPIDGFRFHDVYECVECNRLTYNKIEDCCKDPFKVMVFKYTKGIATAVYEQCYNCGGCSHMKKPLSPKKYGEFTRGDFSTDRLEQWKEDKQKEYDRFSHLNFIIQESGRSICSYDEYLQSEHWRTLRLKILERDKDICQFCKQDKATVVHHLTYKNLGHETLDELISSCKACHESYHDKLIGHQDRS